MARSFLALVLLLGSASASKITCRSWENCDTYCTGNIPKNRAKCVGWSEVGTIVVGAVSESYTDGFFVVFNADTCEVLLNVTEPNFVYACDITPDGTKVVSGLSGSGARDINVWDVATGTQDFNMSGHSDGLMYAKFVDNQYLISTGQDQQLREWDITTGSEVTSRSFSPDAGKEPISFSPNKTLVLTGS